jgi:hypothetical protein
MKSAPAKITAAPISFPMALPFGRLWYGEPNAASNAVAKRDVDGKWKFGLDLVI